MLNLLGLVLECIIIHKEYIVYIFIKLIILVIFLNILYVAPAGGIYFALRFIFNPPASHRRVAPLRCEAARAHI